MGILTRALHLLPPELAHRVAIRALPLLPPRRPAASPRLGIRLLGHDFSHPIGLAAGFDKSAEAHAGLLRQGFALVEIGTVTPRPQAGNLRPRLFRLPEDRALINRMGFNNDGLARVQARLRRRNPAAGVVGANIGMNRDTRDPIADYLTMLEGLYDLVDYLAVNLSSPNTPGLRALQAREPLTELFAALLGRRARLAAGAPPKPLLLKIAPDLTPSEEAAIAEVALALGIDGLIIANTTTARPPDLRSRHKGEAGGLSGRPLFAPSTALLGRMFRLTEGRIPLIGVGGVFSAADAYAKIRMGAALVQLYTGLVYEGPGLVRTITRGLDRLLAQDGLDSISAAVGLDLAG